MEDTKDLSACVTKVRENVLPTIADILGLRLPFEVDGDSVLDREVEGSTEIGEEMGQAVAKRAANVGRKYSLFGSGERPRDLYRIGRHRGLVGRLPGEIGVSGQANVKIEVDNRCSVEAEHIHRQVGSRFDFRSATVLVRKQVMSRTSKNG